MKKALEIKYRDLLKKIPFFRGYGESELQIFLDQEQLFVPYPPGGYLIHQGDAENSDLFLLLEGCVQVTRNSDGDEDLVLCALSQGAVFGEISFLTKRPRTTNIIAAEPVLVLCINSTALERIDWKIHMRIKDQLIELLVNRIDDMNQLLVQKDQSNRALIEAVRKTQYSIG